MKKEINRNQLNSLLLGLEKKSKQNPDNINILNQLGRIYRLAGDLEKAAGILEKVHQMNPNNSNALLHEIFSRENISQIMDMNNVSPSPFYVQKDFLPPSDRKKIMDYVISQKANF